MPINAKFFFAQAKATLFGGSFTKKQVDGINAILTEWQKIIIKKMIAGWRIF